VKRALLYSAGGKGKEFWVSAGTDADGEKSDLHMKLPLCVGVQRYATRRDF
jgi:hypothetical protein